MSDEDDIIRELLEQSVRTEGAPPEARRSIDQQIGARELVFGMVELFSVVPAMLLRDFLTGSRNTSTTPEEEQ